MSVILGGRLFPYVSGPFGKNDEGRMARVEAALAAGARLLAAGLQPLVPHTSHWWGERHPQHYERWMEYDFAWLERCDAVLRIPGESPGADREVALARTKLKKPVFFDESRLVAWARGEVPAARCAWSRDGFYPLLDGRDVSTVDPSEWRCPHCGEPVEEHDGRHDDGGSI